MRKIFFILLISQLGFSQSKSITLEFKIYQVLDLFLENPSPENLITLENSEKNFQPQTKQDYLAIVILNCNKAYYENQFGQISKAIYSYEKAWHIFQKYDYTNFDITENCLKKLGNLYTIIGDYDNAENIIKQYYYAAEKQGNHLNKVAAIINLSFVYKSSGRNELAIQLLTKTLKSEKLTTVEKAKMLNNLGTNQLVLGS